MKVFGFSPEKERQLTYQITKKGRKWLEGVVPDKGWKAQIEINQYSNHFEAGNTYTFVARFVREVGKYGASTKVYPIGTEEMSALEEQKKALAMQHRANKIERWLRYVEDSAARGYWYATGERILKELSVQDTPDAMARLEAARKTCRIAAASSKALQYLGYIEDSIERRWYDHGEGKVNVAIATIEANGGSAEKYKEALEGLRKRRAEIEESQREQQQQQQQLSDKEGLIYLSGGSGYGDRGWYVGQIVRNSKYGVERGEPQYLYILKAQQQYHREDGMSFGVGDEKGYSYWAVAREATPEESAELRAYEERIAAQKKAWDSLRAIGLKISDVGEYPKGKHSPEGVEYDISLSDTARLYGGGEWFVVGSDYIWYVVNNGHDGDYWACNNVLTGGAGAVGCRIDFDQEVADEIKTLYSIWKS